MLFECTAVCNWVFISRGVYAHLSVLPSRPLRLHLLLLLASLAPPTTQPLPHSFRPLLWHLLPCETIPDRPFNNLPIFLFYFISCIALLTSCCYSIFLYFFYWLLSFFPWKGQVQEVRDFVLLTAVDPEPRTAVGTQEVLNQYLLNEDESTIP